MLKCDTFLKVPWLPSGPILIVQISIALIFGAVSWNNESFAVLAP